MTFPLPPLSGVATGVYYSTITWQGKGWTDLINASPGSINPPIIYEPPATLTGGEPVIWIIGTGKNDNWGGAKVYMSVDNSTYGPVGIIFRGGVQGTLTALFPFHYDPDNVDTLAIDISESGSQAQIISMSNLLADDLLSLIYVDGELCSYSTATLTGPQKYNLTTHIRRGAYGTPISAHPIGSKFAILSQLTLRQGYYPNMIGQTVWFKFPSFNLFGAESEDISTVTAYEYVLTGLGYASGGLMVCPVDFVLSAGASEDWGRLGSKFMSSCDWGILATTSAQSIELGVIEGGASEDVPVVEVLVAGAEEDWGALRTSAQAKADFGTLGSSIQDRINLGVFGQ